MTSAVLRLAATPGWPQDCTQPCLPALPLQFDVGDRLAPAIRIHHTTRFLVNHLHSIPALLQSALVEGSQLDKVEKAEL